MASVQEEGRSCTTKPFKPVYWLHDPDHVPPMGKVLGPALSSHNHGAALPGETSHFLSASWAIYTCGAASFSRGGHLATIKMAQRNHKPKYVFDENRPPFRVPLAWKVHSFPPTGDMISSPRTQKRLIPVGFSAGSWTPGLFRSTLTVSRTGHRL